VVSSQLGGPIRLARPMSPHGHSVDHVAVVIPARNEADTILRTLGSVDAARRRLRPSVTSSCVVVLDDCTDTTEQLVRQHLHRERDSSTLIVSSDARNVGAARALGAAAAFDGMRRHDATPATTWLASTDADTLVPPHWLHEQLRLANRGVDAVAGIVELATSVDSLLRTRFDDMYLLGHDGTHGHVHGANMGMRAITYLAAGGWHPLVCGEDHDLWCRLGHVGNRVSSTAISVLTSDRLRGRAPAGFAADLAELQRAEPVA
jgi:hypothetical protein